MTNSQLAEVVRELSNLVILAGDRTTSARQYMRLAAAINRHPEPVADLARQNRLRELPDVGPTYEKMLRQYLAHGTCDVHQHYESIVPAGLLELVRQLGLSARTVRRLFTELGVTDRTSLRKALRQGRLSNIRGIGVRTLRALQQRLDDPDA